jgi:hypothetical protein
MTITIAPEASECADRLLLGFLELQALLELGPASGDGDGERADDEGDADGSDQPLTQWLGEQPGGLVVGDLVAVTAAVPSQHDGERHRGKGTGPFFASRRVQLALLAGRHLVPAIYGQRNYADAGGLERFPKRLNRGIPMLARI